MGGVYVRKKSLFSILIVLFMLFVTACSSSNENKSNSSSPSGNLVIYTARDQTVVDKVKNMFNEKYPDIQVDVLTMGAQEILERVRAEKTNPQADF